MTRKEAIQRALTISARANADAGHEIDFVDHDDIKTDLVELREVCAAWHKRLEQKLLIELQREHEPTPGQPSFDNSDFEGSGR